MSELGENWPRIVNETGIGRDTKLISASGEEIGGIKKIIISPITKDTMVEAEITLFAKVEIAAFIEKINNPGDK